MQRLFLTLFCVCLLLFTGDVFATADTNASTPTLQERYKQAKFFYKQLQTNKDMQGQRALWLKAGRKFRKVYLTNPKSEHAPSALFMLGKLHLEMYGIFGRKGDLKESLGYFSDCQSLFPHHRLADDALFALAGIYSEKLADHKAAAKHFTTILHKYSGGDMHPRAASQLKHLSSTYDIALPGSLINGTNHKKLTNVLPVKYWSSPDYSRVIIKISEPVAYSARLLPQNDQKPRRLYIDFENSYIKPRYRTPIPIADGLLKRIRTGQHSKETVRVVLDIESISDYKIFSLPDPFRVVIDIRGDRRPIAIKAKKIPVKHPKILAQVEEQPPVLRQQKKTQPAPGEEQELIRQESIEVAEEGFSLAQQLGLGVRRIVIDPGHGGKDPGAIAHGLKEKDVVLSLAHKLKKYLETTLGCEVLLTRDDDTYIPLEERTAIANGNNADLFLSLHINAHPQKNVKGLETYFLNLSSSKEAMRVAAFENATSQLHMSDLQDVLADIMKNSKVHESSRLANNVHATLVSGLEASGFPLKDLGVKQAPFYVLIGAEMPAILLEVAFISNPEEARLLQNGDFLDSVAIKASQGIESYINSNSALLLQR